jgi:hypothetical protein
MATVVLDPYAYELDALKERRRVSGLDRLDEVWEGVLHMVRRPLERSGLIDLGSTELADRLAWPRLHEA